MTRIITAMERTRTFDLPATDRSVAQARAIGKLRAGGSRRRRPTPAIEEPGLAEDQATM
jgi:hypothetical protein